MKLSDLQYVISVATLSNDLQMTLSPHSKTSEKSLPKFPLLLVKRSGRPNMQSLLKANWVSSQWRVYVWIEELCSMAGLY